MQCTAAGHNSRLKDEATNAEVQKKAGFYHPVASMGHSELVISTTLYKIHNPQCPPASQG